MSVMLYSVMIRFLIYLETKGAGPNDPAYLNSSSFKGHYAKALNDQVLREGKENMHLLNP